MVYDDSEKHQMNFDPDDDVVIKLTVEKNGEVVYEAEGEFTICALIRNGEFEAMVGPKIDIDLVSSAMVHLNQEVISLLQYLMGSEETTKFAMKGINNIIDINRNRNN